LPESSSPEPFYLYFTFTQIFATQGTPPVLVTPAANSVFAPDANALIAETPAVNLQQVSTIAGGAGRRYQQQGFINDKYQTAETLN
jgi:hypothetical protein